MYLINFGDLFYMYCSCSLLFIEVRDFYNKGSQEEAEEFIYIQFVDREIVFDLIFDIDMWSIFVFLVKGCIMLYKFYN